MIILVAEDNALLAFMIEEALAENGHVILGPASTAEAASRLAGQTRPELALIDIDLEGERSGIDLAWELQDRWGIPALFTTGQIAKARANAGVALGVIAKPFSPATVVKSIEIAWKMLHGEPGADLPSELELF